MDDNYIDLDAVLDEFELREDEAERAARAQNELQSDAKSRDLSDMSGEQNVPAETSMLQSSDQPSTSSRPSGSADFQSSGIPDFQLSGSADCQPFGILDFQPSGSADCQPSGIPDFQPSGSADYQPCGILDFQPSGSADIFVDVSAGHTQPITLQENMSSHGRPDAHDDLQIESATIVGCDNNDAVVSESDAILPVSSQSPVSGPSACSAEYNHVLLDSRKDSLIGGTQPSAVSREGGNDRDSTSAEFHPDCAVVPSETETVLSHTGSNPLTAVISSDSMISGSVTNRPALSIGSATNPPPLSIGSATDPPAFSIGAAINPPLSIGSATNPPPLSIGSAVCDVTGAGFDIDGQSFDSIINDQGGAGAGAASTLLGAEGTFSGSAMMETSSANVSGGGVITDSINTETVSYNYERCDLVSMHDEGCGSDIARASCFVPDTADAAGRDSKSVDLEGSDPATSYPEGLNSDTVDTKCTDLVNVDVEGSDMVTAGAEGRDTNTALSEGSDSVTSDVKSYRPVTADVQGSGTATITASDAIIDDISGADNGATQTQETLIQEKSEVCERSNYSEPQNLEKCDTPNISFGTGDSVGRLSTPTASIYQIAYPCGDEGSGDLPDSTEPLGSFEPGSSNDMGTSECNNGSATRMKLETCHTIKTDSKDCANSWETSYIPSDSTKESGPADNPVLGVVSEDSAEGLRPGLAEEDPGGVSSRLLRHHSIDCVVRTAADKTVLTETCEVPERPDSLEVTPYQPAEQTADATIPQNPAVSDSSSSSPVPPSAVPSVPSSSLIPPSAVPSILSTASMPPPAVPHQLVNLGDQMTRSGGSIVTVPGAQSGATAPARTQLGSTAAGRGPVTPGQLTSSSTDDNSLGRVAPIWVPDDEMDSCMSCDLKFTLVRRRHHCRACGRLLCAGCCNQRARLEFMDMREARVCLRCMPVLERVQQTTRRSAPSLTTASGGSAAVSPPPIPATTSAPAPAPPPVGAGCATGARTPNPNNPLEYCSTVPPLEQAGAGEVRSPLSVMVPCSALRRPSDPTTPRTPGGSKQVMFSDGIRPGGDLTEPQGHSRSSQQQRGSRSANWSGGSRSRGGAVTTLAAAEQAWCSQSDLLPPLLQTEGNAECGDVSRLSEQAAADLLRAETSCQWAFQVNTNLLINTSFVKLDCCVGSKCWVFSSSGLRAMGQDEVVLVLQCDSDSEPLPRDVFVYYRLLYIDAAAGKFVGDLGHNLVSNNFLGFREHGGFLYARPSLQCLQSLPVSDQPYLIALLIHKWEVPWAKVFPLRLMLRLGAEFRYYPCPVVSVRCRKPVFFEIGQTIINLLADFRSYTYVLPTIPGMHIHMEDKRTSVLLPRNRFEQVSKTVNNSGEHVLSFGACFSQKADSHLVCVQSEEGRYQTQAINIHNRPRHVTGASFVVFNGALKSSLNLTAKSSIVEDGLMYQISPESMVSLRERLRKMEDVSVECGPVGGPVEETLSITWVDDDVNYNVGVTSVIDGRCMDGVMSMRVHSGSEFTSGGKLIRWTEVFLLQGDEPSEFSRLAETLSRSTCHALLPLLSDVCEQKLSPLALRATVDPDTVGYEAGSCGKQLPPEYMKLLDSELVPVLHLFAARGLSQPICVELVFYVLRC